MAGFFYNLGRTVGPVLRKGKWVFQSFAGTEIGALQAELEVGRDLARAFLQQTPADADPAARDLLTAIGPSLVSRLKDQRRRFSFHVVHLPEVNAFALPGGYVFVTRLLLETCAWDRDEVAFILGHEMAHVLHGHAMDRIVNSLMLTAATRVVPVGRLIGPLLGAPLLDLLHKAYSQDQELEADRLGARLAASAGFDATAAVRLLQRLRSISGGDAALGSYFSSHPPYEVRVENLRRIGVR